MTKITIIGNSHVGALRMGWDQIASDFPNVSLSFLATSNPTFHHMDLGEDKTWGILESGSAPPEVLAGLDKSFGRSRIDLAAADVVIFAGVYISEISNVRLLLDCSVDEIHSVEGRPRLSKAAYLALADAVADRSLLDKRWHNWTNPSLFVMPVPRAAETCNISTVEKYKEWTALANGSPVGAAVLSTFLDRTARAFAAVGVNFISPPDEVYGPTGLTKAQFNRTNPIKANNLKKIEDHGHMNAAYGAIVLRHALLTINAAKPA